MPDLSKQIIPDSQAVARCLDPKMLEILDSHSTFTISELLEKINQPLEPTLSRAKTNLIFDKARSVGSYSSGSFFNDLSESILVTNENTVTIINILSNGTNCNLLQPDGKGWQKGKLKICFEFIPEETETVATQTTPVETQPSPLDEIRQLSNELTSMVSIEQN
jgi:hypothetical protein